MSIFSGQAQAPASNYPETWQIRGARKAFEYVKALFREDAKTARPSASILGTSAHMELEPMVLGALKQGQPVQYSAALRTCGAKRPLHRSFG